MSNSAMIFDLDEEFNDSTAPTTATAISPMMIRTNSSSSIFSNNTMETDSIMSTSPSNSLDDNLLATPVCRHHFLYDSNFLKNNNNTRCNCGGSTNTYTAPNVTALPIPEGSTHHYTYSPKPSSNHMVNSTTTNTTTTKGFSFNRSTFDAAKDNYRIWLDHIGN